MYTESSQLHFDSCLLFFFDFVVVSLAALLNVLLTILFYSFLNCFAAFSRSFGASFPLLFNFFQQ